MSVRLLCRLSRPNCPVAVHTPSFSWQFVSLMSLRRSGLTVICGGGGGSRTGITGVVDSDGSRLVRRLLEVPIVGVAAWLGFFADGAGLRSELIKPGLDDPGIAKEDMVLVDDALDGLPLVNDDEGFLGEEVKSFPIRDFFGGVWATFDRSASTYVWLGVTELSVVVEETRRPNRLLLESIPGQSAGKCSAHWWWKSRRHSRHRLP